MSTSFGFWNKQLANRSSLRSPVVCDHYVLIPRRHFWELQPLVACVYVAGELPFILTRFVVRIGLHQSLALDHLQQPPKGVGAAVADSVVSGSREAPGFDSALSAAAAPRMSASIGSPVGIFRGCAAMREVLAT